MGDSWCLGMRAAVFCAFLALCLAGLSVYVPHSGIPSFIYRENPVSSSGYEPRTVDNIRVAGYRNIGPNMELFTEKPSRVIAVGENINETLVALGVEDCVICPVSYGNPYYVPSAGNAEAYGKISFYRTDILNPEMVLSMEPDLIVAGQSLFNRKRLRSTDFWNERGVHTFLPVNANAPSSRSYRETVDQEAAFVLGLGSIFDKEDAAEKMVKEWDDEIRSIRSKTAGMPQKKVLIIEMMGRQIVSYDDTKLAGDMCRRLGAYVPRAPGGTVSLEYLIEENPDVLFVVKSGGNPKEAAEQVKRIPALESLHCIRTGQVYGIMLNDTYNSAVKTGEGIRIFAEGIYPDIMNHEEWSKEMNENR